MKLPFKVKSVTIPDGKDEKEMWHIFKIIYDELQIGDELYIDLTHSFRYLPMLLLVLSNYAKFLKKTSVKSLTYGNFEARNIETNEAPISDLLPIVALQDWTIAAANFTNNGDVKELKKLSESTLNPILKQSRGSNQEVLNIRDLTKNIEKTVMDFQTCRGMNIIKAINISRFRENFNKVQTTFIEPLNPIIETIDASFNKFDEDYNIENGFHAAKWCFDNGLYQQAVTILQENVISFFCDKYDIPIDNERKREHIVKKALNDAKMSNIAAKMKQPEEDKNSELSEVELKLLNQLKEDELLKEIAGDYSSLSSTRNDINHNGMRSSHAPLEPEKLIRNIEKNMDSIFRKMNNPK
jgi:CRISPR-associated DxTHG motif protein